MSGVELEIGETWEEYHSSLGNLIWWARLELGDVPTPMAEEHFFGDGVRRDFYLHAERVQIDKLTVRLYADPMPDPVPVVEDVDTVHGVLRFDIPPPNGARIEVSGYVTELFSDFEWIEFVRVAFVRHVWDRPALVEGVLNEDDELETHLRVDLLPMIEHPLISLLACIEALWALATSASFDIDIHAPEGMDVPRSQRYPMIRQQLAAMEERYESQCNALGVGFQVRANYKRKRTM